MNEKVTNDRPVIQRRALELPTRPGRAGRVVFVAGSTRGLMTALTPLTDAGHEEALYTPRSFASTLTHKRAATNKVNVRPQRDRNSALYVVAYQRPDSYVTATLWYDDNLTGVDAWTWDCWVELGRIPADPPNYLYAAVVLVHDCAWALPPNPTHPMAPIYAKWLRYALSRTVHRTAELLDPNETTATGYWRTVEAHDADAYTAFVEWRNYQALMRIGDI